MDATQTSEPTEAEPGSPGQASAFRRALDDQAAMEGPLDLTVPLDIAQVRAALSNSGPLPAVAANAAPPPAGPGSTPPREHDGRHSRRSKRLGRIAVFVVLAATASLGTAYALVQSTGGQGSSVSLPATDGNIPVAPSQKPSGQGRISAVSGSSSATAAPGLSRSPTSTPHTGAVPPAVPSYASSATASAGPSGTPSPSAPPSSSPAGPPSQSPSSPPASGWVTLYQGIQNESQEVSQVQSMLDALGYLQNWHHHEYVNLADFGVWPDPSGTYGPATADAIAEFQQQDNLYASPSGECDAATYQALTQAVG